MKKILIAALAAVCMCGQALANPDIKEVLSGLGSKGGNGSNIVNGLKGAVEGVLTKTNLTEKDIEGSWKYSAPAVVFKSENLLKKAGGSAAASVVEGKIAPYYQKAGITKLTAEFKADKTMTFQIGKAKLSGTYAVKAGGQPGEFTFKFKAVGKVPVGTFTGHVEKVGNKISICFDASKLISLVNAIAKVSGTKSISAAASILNSYDGMMIGFELAKAR